MKLSSPQKEIYSKDRLSAPEAQRLAEEIAAGPIVFQVSRLMIKFGILDMLRDHPKGVTLEKIIEKRNYPVMLFKCYWNLLLQLARYY